MIRAEPAQLNDLLEVMGVVEGVMEAGNVASGIEVEADDPKRLHSCQSRGRQGVPTRVASALPRYRRSAGSGGCDRDRSLRHEESATPARTAPRRHPGERRRGSPRPRAMAPVALDAARDVVESRRDRCAGVTHQVDDRLRHARARSPGRVPSSRARDRARLRSGRSFCPRKPSTRQQSLPGCWRGRRRCS